jgi:hypothetical protein
MRVLLALLALAAATPAAAQSTAAELALQNDLLAQQQAAQQRAVALDNQLMALEAQIRTERALADIRAQSARPYLPLPPLPPGEAGPRPPSPQIDTSKLVSIPDDRLAASNAAVREVTQGRR